MLDQSRNGSVDAASARIGLRLVRAILLINLSSWMGACDLSGLASPIVGIDLRNAGLQDMMLQTLDFDGTGILDASSDPGLLDFSVSMDMAGLVDTCGANSGLEPLAPWPMLGCCAAHQGRSPYHGPRVAGIRWSSKLGSVSYGIAVGAEGRLYFGTGSGFAYSLDATTGKQAWVSRFPAQGQSMPSAPALGAKGNAYLTAGQTVFALDRATGQVKWSFPTGGTIVASPAIGTDGTVYIGSADHNVYAIDGDDGKKRWSFTCGDQANTSVVIGADAIYAGSSDHTLYSLQPATGVPNWTFVAGAAIGGVALGGDRTVFAGSVDKRLYAIDHSTGRAKWSFAADGQLVAAPAIGSDGTLYVGSTAGSVYAVEPRGGKQKWAFRAGNGGIFSSCSLDADDVVYVGTFDHKLYALDPVTGIQRWNISVEGAIWCAPAIGADGTVFIGDISGVYAVGP